ncbi:MAG: SDR family NAD(P)-dependent oxidoreductase [Actinomycetota bacterium]|nr:SDR family NAD(P)-dependent oxidoreductase [Actinomycetota bacterium]
MTRTDIFDTVLDRSVVLGYTRIGPALRKRWWPADPTPGSMTGKRVLITGATSGIGKSTAAGLARLGGDVHVLGHDEKHLTQALADLRSQVPEGSFHGEACDVSSMADVRRFCADFSERVPALHTLIHNAGTMAHERTETPEGHEFTLATMVLGPHLMTALLRDRLAAADGASVLFTSSGGMYAAALRDDDPEYRKDKYSGPKAYARTKRMQVVLAQMWDERLSAENITCESMHPGWVDTRGVANYLPKFRALTLPFMRDADSGADTLIWLAATRPGSDGSEHFWHDRRLRPTSYGRERDQGPDKRRRLWDYVASATGTVDVP